MPVNRRRGEVAAILDGREHTLCLTLGALARLEDHFRAGDLSALAVRFGQGSLSARDVIAIVHAGLTGAGSPVTMDEVAAMRCEGGVAGFAALAAELLAVTFGAIDERRAPIETSAAGITEGPGVAVVRTEGAPADRAGGATPNP